MTVAVLSQTLYAPGAVAWKLLEFHGVLSKLAYSPIEEIKQNVPSLGFDDAHELSQDSMFCFLGASEYGRVLVFRGSELEPADWFTNFDFGRRDTTGGFVHRGFYDAYESLKPAIKSALGSTSGPLWLTGHSLGGALAAVCAYELACDRLEISGLLSFGQPRFAGPRLAKEVGRKIGPKYIRVVNGNDIVPTMPPYLKDSKRRIACHHAGNLVWFKDGRVKRNSFLGRVWRELTPTMSDEEFERIHIDPRTRKETYSSKPLGSVGSPISDHYMDQYLELIRKHQS